MKIKIVSIKERKNDCIITFEYDQEFINLIKKIYKIKRLSQKRMEKILKQALYDGIELLEKEKINAKKNK